MIRCILIFFIISLGSTKIYAQLSNQILLNDPENLQKISKGGGGYYASNPTSNEIEGSPYLINSVKARIISKDKFVYEIPVIYDTNKDVFIIDNRGVKVELNEKRIDSIFIDERKFIPINGGYYEIISNSSVTFLKKHKAEIQRADYVPALNTGSKNRSWKINTSYFFIINSTLTPVTLTKASIKEVLGLSNEQMSSFQRKGYKFNKEMDVVMVLLNLNR